MKTMNLIKIIPVVLMGLFLSVNLPAAGTTENDTLDMEMSVQMESWMFDTNYLSSQAEPVEAWMFDASWLEEEVETVPVESWMTDSKYLANESQMVESWMLDETYLNN